VEVTAEVGLSHNDSGGFVLSAALAVIVTGVDQKKAEDLVESAHKICPLFQCYSGQRRGRDHRFGSLSRIGPNSGIGSYYDFE
jgi:hypothetical protein